MTPQSTPRPLAAQPGTAVYAPLDNTHLTDDQFGELLVRRGEDASPELALAEAHLLACEPCAAEFASLREAVAFFREASSAYADNELQQMPRWVMPERYVFSHAFVPAYWVAAAAMLLTALLPLQLLHWYRLQSPPAAVASATANASTKDSSMQSDAVLLEDVNRDISASVPPSMQALADPTGTSSSTGIAASAPASTQRKD